MPPPPPASKIDFNASPKRTKKHITLRCISPFTEVKEQSLEGNTMKFTEHVIVDVAVRDIKAEGTRLGREPADLVSIEKHLVDFFAINRLAMRNQGIQYMDIVGTQTYAELEGGEENQQVWYHTLITVKLHYWMLATQV